MPIPMASWRRVPGRAGCVRVALIVSIVLAAVAPASAAERESPLVPLDMSSPRATLHGFMGTVDRIAANFREPDRGRAVRAENARLLERILRCLDLSAVPPSLVDSIASLMNDTDPSHIAKFAPPECELPKAS